jgi:hypothetical protein
MKLGPLFAGALVLALPGCADALKPRAIQTTDRCTRCQRPIDEVRIAGEIVDSTGRALVFKTPWCMATYIQEQGDRGAGGTVYVTDYASARLVRADSAMFVRAVIDRRTNTRDYLAFRHLGDAVAASKEHQSAVVDWLAIRRFVAAEHATD